MSESIKTFKIISCTSESHIGKNFSCSCENSKSIKISGFTNVDFKLISIIPSESDPRHYKFQNEHLTIIAKRID